MELKQAKDNVRQLAGKSFIEAIKIDDIAESIRMVCEVAVHDLEAKSLLGCIPDSMAYMGLYPHEMRRFDILPDGVEEIRPELMKELFDKRLSDKNPNK